MVKALIFLVVMLACDIGAMKKDHLSATGAASKPSLLRSSPSDLNQSKGVSSRRILGRAASVDTEDPNSKKVVLDLSKKFTRSDDTTTSSSTSSHISCSSVSSSQIVSNHVSSRSSSKSPRELKASRVEPLKNMKKDKSQKIGYQLCTAIKENKFFKIKDILNAVDEEGKTLLILAIEQERNETVLDLLDYPGIDVNKSDKFGRTPLITAIQKLMCFDPSSTKAVQESVAVLKINNPTIALIERLLIQEGIDINKADNRKNSPLHHAVLKHSKDVIELLLRDHRINSLSKNSDKHLASQLINKKFYEDASSVSRIFFDRATLDALANDEAFDLHLNEKMINDEKIKAVVDVIKKGVEKDHGQDGDRKLPEKESLFLKDEFIKKTLIYRLEESKQAKESEKIEIIINSSDTTQEI